MTFRLSKLLLLGLSSLPVLAQVEAPITVSVDATEAARQIFHARLTIPVTPGPVTLVYPRWIPGNHGPTGPITELVGLKWVAQGQPLAWRRDLIDLYAFHGTIPAGVTRLEVSLDLLAAGNVPVSNPSATDQLAVLSWNQVVLYPQGQKTDQLTYQAQLTLPLAWKYGTALPLQTTSAQTLTFAPVSLTTLVDSPVILGAHYRTVPLSKDGRHQLDIVADSEAALALTPDSEKAYQHLITQTNLLFGARHYNQYHFLLSLSDRLGFSGLEHHESSDNRAGESALTDPLQRELFAGLLPHEFVHSWNGKYRRPVGLNTADFQEPMQDDLLWVYEGLTQYLGTVLTARSGLWDADTLRDYLAVTAAAMDHRPGRAWRSVQDTADSAPLSRGLSPAWSSYRRGTDYYAEGLLIWLEVDALLRQQSQGRRSLDDFCRSFFGAPNTAPLVKPYTFDEVVMALNQVVPYDWRTFLLTRLNTTALAAPLGGITGGGWRVVYTDTLNDYLRATETVNKSANFIYSLGFSLNSDGTLGDVLPDSVAAKAGLAPGMKLLGVDGRTVSAERLRQALKVGKTTMSPLELLALNGDFYRMYRLDYHGGEQYPHLERDKAQTDWLGKIIIPLGR